ncbi:MAG TPA: methyltransferase domain-containing protein [Pilimelia sp.]|nr:methyltransferase domain-containing protein [Pilimelia sp.]
MRLRDRLVSAGRTRWLDVGCGGEFEPGFDYLDVFPTGLVPAEHRDRYHRVDIVHPGPAAERLRGGYDLVRLQHTLEHLGFEDGQAALRTCAALLRPGGLILITVPDLRVHVRRYLDGSYRNWAGFAQWARGRVPPDAPDSAYFSVYAHSMTFEEHRWCYDYEGLAYQLRRTGAFGGIRELRPDDPLASLPFTHNRPEEDVCVLAELLPRHSGDQPAASASG